MAPMTSLALQKTIVFSWLTVGPLLPRLAAPPVEIVIMNRSQRTDLPKSCREILGVYEIIKQPPS